MKLNKIFLNFFFLFTVLAIIPACVDLEFDEPPVGELPNLSANTTIAELVALHTVGNAASEITGDIVIGGTVVADDQFGNFYKNVVVQDATGGITVRMNSTGLYNEFPIGRQVFIKCQGLFIGDYNGLIQLNGSVEDAIEEVLIDQYVIGGERDKPLDPETVSISDLNKSSFLFSKLSTLIKLDEVEFTSGDSNVSYADVVNHFAVSRTVQDCDGNSIIVRTSGYADFAGELTPQGNGSLEAVVSVYNGTPQLTLRDLSDVNMTGARCSGSSGNEELITIAELRTLFDGGATEGPKDKKIRGVVISDKDNSNMSGKNMVLQEGTTGITLRFASSHNFSLGEEIEVVVSEQPLSEYHGLMQIGEISNELAKLVGSATPPTPRGATVNEIIDNLDEWESTLVKISGATLGGSATFSGGVTLSDASGSIEMYTTSYASFADAALPTGEVDVVAIVSRYDAPQVIIRNLNDVIGGGGGDPEMIATTDLRDLFGDGVTTVPPAKLLRGIVISDKDKENLHGQNLVIQDEDGGIIVRFADPHSFALGEDVEINVSGMQLSEYKGLLQVSYVPLNNANTYGPGTMPEARVATIEQIIANFEDWESTLVKISSLTISGGGTYSGSKTISDGTGEMILFTRTQATFAGTDVPTAAVTITGILTEYDVKQISIRNLADIVE